MKRFYFTADSQEEQIGIDHIGNLRGARTKAQKLANELNEAIYINSVETEDILDVIYPDDKFESENKEDNKVESENKEVKTVIKYNKSNIMRRAWEIKEAAELKTSNDILRRNPLRAKDFKLEESEKAVFSECLKMAWEEARRAVEVVTELEVTQENAEWIAEYETRLKMQGHTGITWNVWSGYGNYRAYYKCSDCSKFWNSKKDHYIDLEVA